MARGQRPFNLRARVSLQREVDRCATCVGLLRGVKAETRVSCGKLSGWRGKLTFNCSGDDDEFWMSHVGSYGE